MFKAFMKAVNDSQANIKEFEGLMNDEESKQILEHVKKSQAEQPQGIMPWSYKDDPDWFKLDSAQP
jgi:hypothetical protein